VHDRLLYAQCWEDPAVLRAALRLRAGEAVLSVASAGDNSLALLLDDAALVTAVDRNATQLHLVRLKVAALRCLDREDTLVLLGARRDGSRRAAARRLALYAALRSDLPAAARAFWDAALPQRWLARGVSAAGKFERYLSLFRDRVLPLVHGRATVERLAGLGDPEEQARFYREVWDTPRWRFLFRIFFGRRVMERVGRERAFFAQVDVGGVGDRFRERARRALVDLPARDNPFLCWILTGEHRATRLLSPWLQPGAYETVAARVDRLTLVQDDLAAHGAAAAPGSYDAFNLSDVFEYLAPDAAHALYAALVRSARPGARLCHWDLLVPRERPADLAAAVEGEPALAAALHRADRAFFYDRVVVERVVDGAALRPPAPAGPEPSTP
jgi:S-adenosylmethionine-diacylglycerol 3-amino-3-carboxypropyl transferase